MGKIKSKAVVLVFDDPKELIAFELGQSTTGIRVSGKRPKEVKLKIVGTFSPLQLGLLLNKLETLTNTLEAE